MPIRILAATVAAAIALSSPGLAHEVTVGPLTLTDLWTRATPPAAPAAGGYLTIANSGDAADRLTGVSSPDAALGEVHEMTMEGDVMTMRPLDGGLEIPAGETVTLAPGGFHLMFTGLTAPLAEGGRFPVTLTFEHAGPVETFLHVEAIGARGPGGEEHVHDEAEPVQ